MAWPETDLSTRYFRFACYRQRRLRHTMHVSLLMHFAFTTNHQLQFLRQGVNDGDTYAVQTTGNFIGVIIEFTACMQNSHDNFRRRNALFRVNTGWDTTAIIGNRHGVVRVNRYHDIFTVTRERFVDSVIYHLEYHVVQTGAVIRVADIHTRALTHRIQPFQDFDTGGVIRIRHQRFSLI